jgi:hypothetical protein
MRCLSYFNKHNLNKKDKTMSHSNKPNLRHYIDIVENAQQPTNEGDWGKAIGGGIGAGLGGLAGTALGPAGTVAGGVGGYEAGKAIGDKVGDWVSHAADKVGQVASGAWNGAKQAYNAPTPGQPPAPQAGKPHTPGKSDPAVLKQQQDLIAKGAKIKADGIMGPATQAAIKQFGGTPQAGQATPAPAAAAPAPAAAAPAAPSPYAGSPEQEKIWNGLTQQDKDWLTQGGGKPNLMDPYIMARAPNGGKPGVAPAPQAGKAAAPVDTTDPLAANNAASVGAKPALTPQQQAQNVLQPGYNKESAEPNGTVLVNEPTIARIVSLANFGR